MPAILAQTVTNTEETNKATRDDRIRNLAYLKWLAAGGHVNPDDPEGVQFWVEAEKEVDAEGTAS